MRRIELTDTFMTHGTVRLVEDEENNYTIAGKIKSTVFFKVKEIDRIMIMEKEVIISFRNKQVYHIEINRDLMHLIAYLYGEDISYLLKPELPKSEQVISDIKKICDSYCK